MDEYEQGGDFDCEIRIKDGQIVQLKMAGGIFKVANPFGIGRLDIILKAFSLIDSLGLIPSEEGEEPEGTPSTEERAKEANPEKFPSHRLEAPTTAQPTKPPQKERQTKAEQPEKATRGPPKGAGGRPPKYSDEIKQRVLELFGQKKKPQAIQKIILDEHGIEVNRNMMHKWRQEQGIRDSGEEEPVCETVEKIETALKKKPEGKYDGYKVVQPTNHDLMIVADMVMCPTEGMAVNVDICADAPPNCGKYINIIRHTETKEPHVRCLAA